MRVSMCDKCKPIDEQIARYLQLRGRITDQQTLDGIAELIRELEAQKKVFHPEE
jgi:hypothetical protein